MKSVESNIDPEKPTADRGNGQAAATGIDADEERAAGGKHDGAQFTAARDSRNRRVPGHSSISSPAATRCFLTAEAFRYKGCDVDRILGLLF
jgi:hypothetical protein